MSIDAFIFDVDGTIADTEDAHRVAFNLAFEHHRLDWHWHPGEYRELLRVTGGKERIRAYIDSLPLKESERARLRGLVPALHADKTRFYGSVVADGAIPLRSGVARLLQEALDDGIKLAIASTTTASNIDALLQSTLGPRGLDMFTVIACGDQARRKKPFPDVYLLALQGLGIPADSAVAFEDSPAGLRAAIAAGLWTVVTPNFWTEHHDFAGASLQLPHLGGPEHPLPGEPGRQLQSAPWLTCAEVVRRASKPISGPH